MAKTNRQLIFVTFIFSGIAAILQLVALGTEQWVVAEGKFRLNNERPSTVQYGLFSGTYTQVLGATITYEIIMTCSVSDNICALICGNTAEERLKSLKRLYNGEAFDFDTNCPRVLKSYISPMSKMSFFARSENSHRDFINSGLYISTVAFLIIAVGFGLFSSGLAVWNTAANPISVYFSIFGMHIYNTIAAIGTLMTLALWGALFGDTLIRNVCIHNTITDVMDSEGLAFLGFSYWLNMASLMFYIVSEAVLYIRTELINKEPQITIEEVQDPGIMLF